jgi:type II secretory pathway pseudopilin PulG
MREFILYSIVAILTVLGLVAAVNFFGQGRDNQNLTAATADLVTLVQNIQGVYSGNQPFSGIGNSNVISGGMAPASMVVGGALTNEFTGAITVAPGTGTPPTSFLVTEAGVPGSVCAKLAGAFTNGGLVSLNINGKGQLTPTGTSTGALTPANIAGNCLAAGANSLVFEFGH